MSEVETQRTLLHVYGQQLVAHAASFFAALGTAMFFTRYFRPREMASCSSLPYLIIAAALFTLAAYTLFRLLLYGRLASFAMWIAPHGNESLRGYQDRVIRQMLDERQRRPRFYRYLSSLIYSFRDLDSWPCRALLILIFLLALLVIVLLASP